MRIGVMMVAATALAACGQEQSGDTPVGATVQAISYDGADAKEDAAKLGHGERLSWILGCKGCHEENLQGGNVTPDEPDLGDMWASNVTLRLANYDDAAFAKFLRGGVPHDGRQLVFMPTESLQYLSDADVAALTAYLRTVPKGGDEQPPVRLGKVWGDASEDADFVPAVAMAARFRKNALPEYGGKHPLGHYIAQTVCAECHNSQLTGYTDFSPNLDIIGTYDDAELMHMLMTGQGKVKKDLGLMSGVARQRTAKMTEHERAELIGFLRDRLAGQHDGRQSVNGDQGDRD